MLEMKDIVLGVISVFGTCLSILVGIVAKMLWDTIHQIKRDSEKLATRVNALEVSIVKIDTIQLSIAEIKSTQQRIEKTISLNEIEAAKIRGKYIEKIDRIESTLEILVDKFDINGK